jgi:hypothetical protein
MKQFVYCTDSCTETKVSVRKEMNPRTGYFILTRFENCVDNSMKLAPSSRTREPRIRVRELGEKIHAVREECGYWHFYPPSSRTQIRGSRVRELGAQFENKVSSRTGSNIYLFAYLFVCLWFRSLTPHFLSRV